MNLRQEIDGVKLKWRKLNSTADIKAIPFKDFPKLLCLLNQTNMPKCFLEKSTKITGTEIMFGSVQMVNITAGIKTLMHIL